jgi:hypothetical protein
MHSCAELIFYEITAPLFPKHFVSALVPVALNYIPTCTMWWAIAHSREIEYDTFI